MRNATLCFHVAAHFFILSLLIGQTTTLNAQSVADPTINAQTPTSDGVDRKSCKGLDISFGFSRHTTYCDLIPPVRRATLIAGAWQSQPVDIYWLAFENQYIAPLPVTVVTIKHSNRSPVLAACAKLIEREFASRGVPSETKVFPRWGSRWIQVDMPVMTPDKKIWSPCPNAW